jgi:hypothetical protein
LLDQDSANKFWLVRDRDKICQFSVLVFDAKSEQENLHTLLALTLIGKASYASIKKMKEQ